MLFLPMFLIFGMPIAMSTALVLRAPSAATRSIISPQNASPGLWDERKYACDEDGFSDLTHFALSLELKEQVDSWRSWLTGYHPGEISARRLADVNQ
jgi:hypothetical protein